MTTGLAVSILIYALAAMGFLGAVLAVIIFVGALTEPKATCCRNFTCHEGRNCPHRDG